MKVLALSAEVAPYVTVGGLSQVMYFLPRALNTRGHDVRIFMPKYAQIDGPQQKKRWKLTDEVQNIHVPIENIRSEKQPVSGYDSILCNIKSYPKTDTTVHSYFLENREYYELRANIYGYKDDHTRFALLSKGCLEWLLIMRNLVENKEKNAWMPDVIMCNDWHTGYFVELARKSKRYRSVLANIPIVLTIHNINYQGNYDFRYGGSDKKDNGTSPQAGLLTPKLQKQNALLRGILYADAVNTVSPSYASQILTPEYGSGLEKTLQRIRGKLTGILNGLDTNEFDPETDPIIVKKYNAATFPAARAENKKNLQQLFFLEEDPNKFLFTISGRLSEQKGWEILLDVLPTLLSRRDDVQLIVLGSGENRYRDKIIKLKKMYPKRVGLHLRSDFRLPRKLFSGADCLLMPSTFEPGGIVALEALRYGAVPLVRRTGGLSDIITDFNPVTQKGNGFSFKNNDSWELYAAIIEMLTIYKQPKLWEKLIRNCMQYDSSWKYAAVLYEELFTDILEARRRALSITPHPAYREPQVK